MRDTIYHERYQKLNTKQREAVDYLEGPLLVVAGPGSGKTELLSLRVANILKSTDTPASGILCLTYTEAGAEAMRERLIRYIGKEAYKVRIHTFHGFAASIQSEFSEYFGVDGDKRAATDVERHSIINNILKALPYDHPWTGIDHKKEFIYKGVLLETIASCKTSALLPDDIQELFSLLTSDEISVSGILSSGFQKMTGAKLSIKNISFIEEVISDLYSHNTPTSIIIATDLKAAYSECLSIGKTSPIAEWKKKYTEKTADGLTLVNIAKHPKILSFPKLYKDYLEQMHTSGLKDFDDLIISLIKTLQSSDTFRMQVEEKFLYILVDEFQDTSAAQMQIVHLLTSSPHHERMPNICAVGDDDQAIFKFQGADISNIINFRAGNEYVNVKTIVLDKNYRSTQAVIDYAASVISQAKIRLETTHADITKSLTAGNASLPSGQISIQKFDFVEQECLAVTDKIRHILASNEHETIAVIASKHAPLQTLLPFLHRENISVSYVKQSNVFNIPPVIDTLDLAEYFWAELNQSYGADDLEAKILQAPYWNISRKDIIKIAKTKRADRSRGYFDIAADFESCSHVTQIINDIREEIVGKDVANIFAILMNKSGIKSYYWSQDASKKSMHTFITYLQAVRTVLESLTDEHQNIPTTLSHLKSWRDRYEQNNLPLQISERFGVNDSRVSLVTSFGSKGLEYDHVFCIQSDDEVWYSKGVNKSPSYPIALKSLLTKPGKEEDDVIRLLFVALTRAKHSLNISHTRNLIRHISNEEITKIPKEKNNELALSLWNDKPFSEDEKVIMVDMVKEYLMPITHVNNFLDLSRGGPEYFITQNLLQFPQPPTESSIYGTAMHKALEELVRSRKQGITESLPIMHEAFRLSLKKNGMEGARLLLHEDKGIKHLTRYYEARGMAFTATDEAEVNVANDGLVIGEAHITGKIDLLRVTGDTVSIIDFKTGKAMLEWEDKAEISKKIKAHFYNNQLMMYRLILELNSKWQSLRVESIMLEFLDDEEFSTLTYIHDAEKYARFKLLLQAINWKIKNALYDLPEQFRSAENSLGNIIEFENYLIEEFQKRG